MEERKQRPFEFTIIKEVFTRNNIAKLNLRVGIIDLELDIKTLFNATGFNLFDTIETDRGLSIILGLEGENLWVYLENEESLVELAPIKRSQELESYKPSIPEICNEKLLYLIKYSNPLLSNLFIKIFEDYFVKSFYLDDYVKALDYYYKSLEWSDESDIQNEICKRNKYFLNTICERDLDLVEKLIENNQFQACISIYENTLKLLCEDIYHPISESLLQRLKNIYQVLQNGLNRNLQQLISQIDLLISRKKYSEANDLYMTALKSVDDNAEFKNQLAKFRNILQANNSEARESIEPQVITLYPNANLIDLYDLEIIVPTAMNCPDILSLFILDEPKKIAQFYQTLLYKGFDTSNEKKPNALYAIRNKQTQKVFSAAFVTFDLDRQSCEIESMVTLKGHRGHNYGSLLLIGTLEILKKKGFHKVVLSATKKGIPTYAKLGLNISQCNNKYKSINEINDIETKIVELYAYYEKFRDLRFKFNFNNSEQLGLFLLRVSELYFRHPLFPSTTKFAQLFADSQALLNSEKKLEHLCLHLAKERTLNTDLTTLFTYYDCLAALSANDTCTFNNIIRGMIRSEKDSHLLLTMATFSGEAKMVTALLDRGISVDSTDQYGNSLVMIAAQTENKELLVILTEQYAANLFIINHEGHDILKISKSPSVMTLVATRKLNRFLASVTTKTSEDEQIILELFKYKPDLDYFFPGENYSTRLYAAMKGFVQLLPDVLPLGYATPTPSSSRWHYEPEPNKKQKHESNTSPFWKLPNTGSMNSSYMDNEIKQAEFLAQ